jgi:hypothetical protein
LQSRSNKVGGAPGCLKLVITLRNASDEAFHILDHKRFREYAAFADAMDSAFPESTAGDVLDQSHSSS